MKTLTMNPVLRGALAIDAVASGVLGVLLASLPEQLARLLHLPETMLLYTGAFLVAYAAFVGLLATRERPPSLLVGLVIAGNALWVLQSVALALSGLVAPTALGYAFVIGQALAVAVFAELQFVGLRKARSFAHAPA